MKAVIILLSLALLALLVRLTRKRTKKETVCRTATFSSTGVWAPYSFECSSGTCVGTKNGSPYDLPILPHSLTVGSNTIAPCAEDAESCMHLYQNCTEQPFCVDIDSVFVTIDAGAMMPELRSDGVTRTFLVSDGRCT